MSFNVLLRATFALIALFAFFSGDAATGVILATLPVYIPGDFGVLQNERIKVFDDQFFNGTNRTLNELKKPIQAAACILGHQDVNFIPSMQENLCTGVTVYSYRACEAVITDCKPKECDLPGGDPNVGLTKEDYDLNDCIQADFKVLERPCESAADWDRIEALERARIKIEIECEIARRLLQFVAANADTPDLADCAIDVNYTLNGNCIEIPGNAWNSTLFADFTYITQQFDMLNVKYLSGKNFWTESFLNQYKGRCCSDNTMLESNDFDICFDTRNVDSTLGGRYTFAMEQNSTIFWNAYEHRTETPVQISSSKDLWTWRETLPRLRYGGSGMEGASEGSIPIYIDVTMQRKCLEGRKMVRCYEYRVNYGLHCGICDCNGIKGILKFLNGCHSCDGE